MNNKTMLSIFQHCFNMDEYNARISGEATQLFHNKLPKICKRFNDLLSDKDFALESINKVRGIIQDSCKKLIREKEKKLTVEAKKAKLERERMKLRQERSDDDEFHTPMNSDSEKDLASPPKKKVKILSKKKKKTVKDSDDESEDDVKDDAMLECNLLLSKMINTLKPELREVSECCNTVRAWVQLQVPEMQDGNNFGVQVQSDMLNEVGGVETKSNAFMQALSVYHLSRAEIAGKLSKHPGVEDYQRSLEELDVKEFISLRLIVREMRNSCVGLLDTFDKNMEKIITPRSHNENILVC